MKRWWGGVNRCGTVAIATEVRSGGGKFADGLDSSAGKHPVDGKASPRRLRTDRLICSTSTGGSQVPIEEVAGTVKELIRQEKCCISVCRRRAATIRRTLFNRCRALRMSIRFGARAGEGNLPTLDEPGDRFCAVQPIGTRLFDQGARIVQPIPRGFPATLSRFSPERRRKTRPLVDDRAAGGGRVTPARSPLLGCWQKAVDPCRSQATKVHRS